MKTKVICLFLLLQLLFLTSCSNKPSTVSSAATPVSSFSGSSVSELETNTLVPRTLTQDNKDLIQLLAMGSQMGIYDYAVSDDIKQVTLSYKEYHNGKLIDTTPIRLDVKDNITTGSFAVVIRQSKEIQTSLVCGRTTTSRTEEMTDVSTLQSNSSVNSSVTTNRAVDFINSPQKTAITPNTDIPIAIYAAINKSDTINLRAADYYTDHPSELADFDLAYVFTCNFSR